MERTEWHNVVVLRKGLSEICERYLRKGMKVYIEGRIQTRSWQDEQGQTRYMTEVNCQEMTMLSGRDEQAPPRESPASTSGPTVPEGGDDLPF